MLFCHLPHKPYNGGLTSDFMHERGILRPLVRAFAIFINIEIMITQNTALDLDHFLDRR